MAKNTVETLEAADAFFICPGISVSFASMVTVEPHHVCVLTSP